MNMKRPFALLLALAASLFVPTAQASQKVAIKSELALPVVLENAQDRNYLKISLTGFPLEIKKRSPINLAIVIDRSSSMSNDNRIEKARDAAVMAVSQLDANDTLSVIAYDSNVEVIVPATRVKDKQGIINKIRALQPRGMTALFAGVSKGLNEVGKHLNKEQVNRVILLSDGQANVGPSSVSQLADLARVAAKKGVAISTMGVGRDYNEDLMTAIAGYSDGNHVFVEKSTDLEKAFAQEFDDVMSVVAQDVEVIIEVADGVKPVRLLGRDGEIRGNTVSVRLNQLYSNQEKYVLLEVIPAKGQRSESKPLAKISVSYDNLLAKRKDVHRESLAVRYSASADEVKKSVAENVLVDSEIQKTTLDNEQAVKLMDEGKMAEAKAILDQSANQLEALPASQPEVQKKIRESVKMNREMGEKLVSSDKSVSRKALKEQNFNMQKQSQK